MDKLTPQQRHKNMAAIHSTGTRPELIVRRGLWRRGFRYRLNHKGLPGHPDLVLRRYRTCIFVNGCFWHGHLVELPPAPSTASTPAHTTQAQTSATADIINSACCRIPTTNRDFWVAKIRRNKERDREEQRQLAAMGWHCITVWECELTPKRREETLESVAFTLNHIFLQDHSQHPRPYQPRECDPAAMPMAAEE